MGWFTGDELKLPINEPLWKSETTYVHTHDWKEVKRTFNPPVVDNVEIKGKRYIELMEECVFGRTNIELRCSVCGDIKFSSTIGQV